MENIIIDFTDCTRLHEVHALLKKQFDFPDYYGANPSALWDCIYPWGGDGPATLYFYGVNAFRAQDAVSKRAMDIILDVFADLKRNGDPVDIVVVN